MRQPVTDEFVHDILDGHDHEAVVDGFYESCDIEDERLADMLAHARDVWDDYLDALQSLKELATDYALKEHL